MTTVILFIIVFSVIVIAHELGHFLLAKANGITVVEFSVGMGPKLLHFSKGGTEYSLRLLPIGGACMFEGESGLEEDQGTLSDGAFPKAKVWARISTVFAGPFFNFILAWLFAMFVVWYAGSDRPVIQDVMDGYPAQEAGMQSGDVVTRLNGERIYLGREINLYTMANPGRTVTVEYLRDGERHTATLVPEYDETEGRYLDHQLPFAGINHVDMFDNAMVLLRLQLRQRIGTNHYISLIGNCGVHDDNFFDILKGKYVWGGTLGYYYDSMFGPMNMTFGLSNWAKSFKILLNLGYYF